MDNITIDLGPETAVEPGDEAVLIGSQGEEAIRAEEVAAPTRHDQLRGHLRALRPGAAAPGMSLASCISMAEKIAASSTPLGGRGRAGAGRRGRASGSSAAPCATRRWDARSPTSTSPSPATPGRGPGGRAPSWASTPSSSRPSSAPGAWSPGDRGWQVDATALRGERIDADLAARDFTVGAVAVPLAGGEPIDPFGGLADLERGVLRAVGEGSFGEDPLRLLRAARLAAGLGLEIDPGTVALARAAAVARRRPRRRAPADRAAPAARRPRPAARPRPARRAGADRGRPAGAGEPARRRTGPQPPPRRPRPHARRARAHAGGRARPRALRRRARRRGRRRCWPSRSPTR